MEEDEYTPQIWRDDISETPVPKPDHMGVLSYDASGTIIKGNIFTNDQSINVCSGLPPQSSVTGDLYLDTTTNTTWVNGGASGTGPTWHPVDNMDAAAVTQEDPADQIGRIIDELVRNGVLSVDAGARAKVLAGKEDRNLAEPAPPEPEEEPPPAPVVEREELGTDEIQKRLRRGMRRR